MHGKSGNFRRQGGGWSVNRWILIAILAIGLVFVVRLALTRGGSNDTDTGGNDDIQTLESLLKNANVPLNANTNSAVGTTSGKTSCDKAYSSISTEEKIVALTFDSSPIVDNTDAILKILKDENVPAFFFLTGEFATDNKEVVKKIADAGFPIGNHSETHTDLTKLTSSTVAEEITKATTNLNEASGKTIAYFFRPPFGSLGPGETIVKQITDTGYCPMLWTIDALDWQKEATAKTVIDTVSEKIKPGAIIMMQFGHETITQALPTVIKNSRDAGYTFVNLENYFSPPTS
jgi:peptidoglycan/xylan/chitin deacetylase (PgdA/CDA1 family)